MMKYVIAEKHGKFMKIVKRKTPLYKKVKSKRKRKAIYKRENKQVSFYYNFFEFKFPN